MECYSLSSIEDQRKGRLAYDGEFRESFMEYSALCWGLKDGRN